MPRVTHQCHAQPAWPPEDEIDASAKHSTGLIAPLAHSQEQAWRNLTFGAQLVEVEDIESSKSLTGFVRLARFQFFFFFFF
jgi:hypothetical protein